MKLAYIDSCVWIAWIEGLPEYKKIIGQAMQTLAEAGWVYCLSEAIMLEVLANPLRLQNTVLVDIGRNQSGALWTVNFLQAPLKRL